MFIVFDMDGTLSLDKHRQHYLEQDPQDWHSYYHACDKDEPNVSIINTLSQLSMYANHERINDVEIWTGRIESVRDKTLGWLKHHGICYRQHFQELKMRPDHDRRRDYQIKNEWLCDAQDRYGPGKPDLVFEDRQRVVDMYRSHGITCCQVDYGDF